MTPLRKPPAIAPVFPLKIGETIHVRRAPGFAEVHLYCQLHNLRVNPPLETEQDETDHGQPEGSASAGEEGVPDA